MPTLIKIQQHRQADMFPMDPLEFHATRIATTEHKGLERFSPKSGLRCAATCQTGLVLKHVFSLIGIPKLTSVLHCPEMSEASTLVAYCLQTTW